MANISTQDIGLSTQDKDISTQDKDISTYEYELAKRHELNYDYMMANRNCIKMEAEFPDYCDFQELRVAIMTKRHAKQAYELQAKVVKFVLYDNQALVDARRKFRDDIKNKFTLLETF